MGIFVRQGGGAHKPAGRPRWEHERSCRLSVSSLDNTLTAKLNAGLSALTAQLDTKFGPLNTSVTGLSVRLDALEASLGSLPERMDAVERSIASLPSTLTPTIDEIVTRRVGQLGGLSVVDNNGVKIGDFVGFDPLYFVPLVGISTADGHSFVLKVYPTFLSGNQVYFGDSLCTEPWVQTLIFDPDPANPTSPIGQAGVQDGVVYASEALAPVEELLPAYRKLSDGRCQREIGSSVSASRATWSMPLSPTTSYRVK